MKTRSIVLLALSILILASCNRPSTSIVRSNSEQQVPLEGEIDTTAMIGATRDEHGCLASGSYSWSELKQDCIRAFEIAHRLNPIEVSESEAVSSAFILFSDDKLRAEVFFPQEDQKNVILDRKEESVYEKDGYKFDEKTYILSINGEKKYQGNLTN